MTAVTTPPAAAARGPRHHTRSGDAAVARALEAKLTDVMARRPTIGISLGVVQAGRSTFSSGGHADIASQVRVTEDTVFRIGSITKTMTAIAVMQLVEGGAIELDAPASTYLRAFTLASGGFSPPTVRHLLTHTAGIPDMRHVSDLRYGGLTPEDGRPPLLSVRFGQTLPSLAEFYRDGLEVVSEPERTFAYSGHGFAALGQIVEDVSGLPLETYLRQRVFEPLGMTDTDLVRSDRLASRLATGYAFGRRGPRPVPDLDWIGGAGGGVYSTTRDLARYASALLGGGANEHGSVLSPSTLAMMFDPQYQPDPRLVGLGLGFFRGEIAGHRVVSHDGILPGFNSRLVVAPDDDLALIGLTNGSPGAFTWLPIELGELLGQLAGDRTYRADGDAAQHPELWSGLCGRYVLPPVSDLRERLLFGGGVDVFVRGGQLLARVLTPIPALLRGMPLVPDDPADPYLFRIDLSRYGIPRIRAVFADVVDGCATVVHTDFGGQPWSLLRAREVRMSRSLGRIGGALAVAGVIAVVRSRRAQP